MTRSPLNPTGQMHLKLSIVTNEHVPRFLHGFASHAFGNDISHRDAV